MKTCKNAKLYKGLVKPYCNKGKGRCLECGGSGKVKVEAHQADDEATATAFVKEYGGFDEDGDFFKWTVSALTALLTTKREEAAEEGSDAAEAFMEEIIETGKQLDVAKLREHVAAAIRGRKAANERTN